MSERSCYALVLIIELVLLTVLLLKFSVLQALPTHGLSRLHSEFGHSVLLPALVMALLQSLILHENNCYLIYHDIFQDYV